MHNVLHLHGTNYYPKAPEFYVMLTSPVLFKNCFTLPVSNLHILGHISYYHSIAEFLKLWSADHKWSSGSALVVLLD